MNHLQDILSALLGIRESVVLATLVRVKGSTYRKPGARMILGSEGPRLGVVSGGCLENDLAERTRSVLAAGQPMLVKYDLGLDLDLVWGTGMGCDGTAEILLQPVQAGGVPPWVHFAAQLLEQRRRCVLATVFSAVGDTSYEAGEVFAYDERSHGLLPMDQGLNVALHRASRRCLEDETAFSEAFPVPGGSLEICIEPVLPPFALWLYGAGEAARPVARMAKELGWFLGILDHRPALATEVRFPMADRVSSGAPGDVIPGLDRRSAALILSHVYDRDRDALACLLRTDAAYIGLQGSRRRCERMLAELEGTSGPLTAAQRERLHYPAGLDLGAEVPEAIALSMLSEAHAALCGRHGGHLKDRQGPIHG